MYYFFEYYYKYKNNNQFWDKLTNFAIDKEIDPDDFWKI